jgi:hypothetical protein
MDPVLLDPALVDLADRGTQISARFVDIEHCHKPRPFAATLIECIRFRGLRTQGRGACRGAELRAGIVCKVATADPQPWHSVANSATLPRCSARVRPPTLRRVSWSKWLARAASSVSGYIATFELLVLRS